jgi:hypothetical protein
MILIADVWNPRDSIQSFSSLSVQLWGKLTRYSEEGIVYSSIISIVLKSHLSYKGMVRARGINCAESPGRQDDGSLDGPVPSRAAYSGFQPPCFRRGFFTTKHQEALTVVFLFSVDLLHFVGCNSQITLRTPHWMLTIHNNLPVVTDIFFAHGFLSTHPGRLVAGSRGKADRSVVNDK